MRHPKLTTKARPTILNSTLLFPATDLLVSPFLDTFPVDFAISSTPLKNQPQYLLSPSPIKKDLFSQLLGTETKQNAPLRCDSSIMEEDYSFEEYSMIDNSSCGISEAEEEVVSENEDIQSDENNNKKRKRKSTAQIKILKQAIEGEGEMNWTKQKIMKMAQVTGLSQSQVYKWCWDQKKKQNKGKLVHRNSYAYQRIAREQNYGEKESQLMPLEQINENVIEKEAKRQGRELRSSRQSQTKQKIPLKLDEHVHVTEKKLNKKLIFS